MAVTVVVALTGCSSSHKAAEPRSEAFHAICAKRGGQVIGQDCVTQSAGGAIIIPIFENETR